jgi:ankyrin repeat protein
LPRTLDETYERILVNIPIEFQSKAINALKWIIYGDDEITLEMLADAIAINHEADPPFNLGDRLLDPSQLLEILPGLITTEGPRNSVQIAHFSVVEYLESARIVDGPANVFHFEQSKAIISIIKGCFDILKSYMHPINQQLLGDDAREFSPLEKHANWNWYFYVESLSTPIDPEISRLVVNFVTNMKTIQQRHHYTLPRTVWSEAIVKRPGKPLDNCLYTACCNRAPNIARIFLDAGADVNFQGGRLGSPLQVAARRDMLEMVRVLLDAGADVNSKDGEFGTALQIAIVRGYLEIVKILLDAGADINSQAGERDTALYIATAEGYLEIVKLLLDRGADVNLRGGKYGTALQRAARACHLEIVKLLLDRGADVNLSGGKYGTALQAAATQDTTEIVQLLLDAGADINSKAGEWGTALYIATSEGHPEIVRLLLDAGADVNSKAGIKGTALQRAAVGGHLEIVKLLLDRGADVNLSGGKYGTALQAAQEYKDEQVVDMLLKAGAK